MEKIYKMAEYEGVDLSSVEIPESKQEQLVELFGGDDFNAQQFYNELSEATNGFTQEDDEALEFDDLLYKVVKAYEKKAPVVEPEPEPIIEPELIPEPAPIVELEEVPPTEEEIREAIELLSELDQDEETKEAIELLKELL